MEKSDYTLEEILEALSKHRNSYAKKRLIYDQRPLGGIGSGWLIAFFLFLPFLEFAAIFNPYIFNMLGIAQAVIFYIVFLSMIMIMIFVLSFINNTKVIRQITPFWQKYFPKIDINLILSSGASPYKDFFKYYTLASNQNLHDKALYLYLKKAFSHMQEENKDLLEAMERRENNSCSNQKN